jgi:hypothetical protein
MSMTVNLFDFLGALVLMKNHPLSYAGQGGDKVGIPVVSIDHSQGSFVDRLTYRMSFS